MLDIDEYLHLAIHASGQNDHHAALLYLKEVLAIDSQHGLAHYLVAAEHAELGLFARAITGMETALRLSPELETARYQLGLLYLQQGQNEKAKTSLLTLQSQTQDVGLRHFATALIALANEQKQTAQEELVLGLNHTQTDRYIRQDMQKLLDNLMSPDSANHATESTEIVMPYLGAYSQAQH